MSKAYNMVYSSYLRVENKSQPLEPYTYTSRTIRKLKKCQKTAMKMRFLSFLSMSAATL